MVRGINAAGEESVYSYNGLGALMENQWIIAKNGYGYHGVNADTSDNASVNGNGNGNSKGNSKGNNGNGNGNVKKTSTVIKQFVVDFTSETFAPLMEHEVNGLDYRYVYSDKARLSVVVQGVENGSASVLDEAGELHAYYHTDYLGTTDYLTSAVNSKIISWTSYNEWGEITHNAVLKCGQRELDLVKLYATHDYDSVLDMYYAKARLYDADNRRFAAVDPIKDGWNWYVYCENQPIVSIDPNGLKMVWIRDYVESRGGTVTANQFSLFGVPYGLKSISVSLNGKNKTYTDDDYFVYAGKSYIDDSVLIRDFNIDVTSYYTTLFCLELYQSERQKGYDADGSAANDMLVNDYSYSRTSKIHPYFQYQLAEDADTLFAEFRSMSTTFFALGDMEDVILDMIDHFREGTGDAYSNEILTAKVKEHPSTQAYVNGVRDILVIALSQNRGDLGALQGENLDELISELTRPKFNTKMDIINGLTIAIHDTWGNSIRVDDYVVIGDTFSGTLNFNIYDHFGLDQQDVEKIYAELAGFRAWFVLQHYDAFNGQYKPFITEINIAIPFEGVIVP